MGKHFLFIIMSCCHSDSDVFYREKNLSIVIMKGDSSLTSSLRMTEFWDEE